MTTLTNDIQIRAPRHLVWRTMAQLDLLATYDPGTKASVITGDLNAGLGAERRCEVRPTGWFQERVAVWEPDASLAFELVDCSFPVTSLRHVYTLIESDGLTRVSQTMTYELKYGAMGRALDAMMLRRKWNSGIKSFLEGLKGHVEAGHHQESHS